MCWSRKVMSRPRVIVHSCSGSQNAWVAKCKCRRERQQIMSARMTTRSIQASAILAFHHEQWNDICEKYSLTPQSCVNSATWRKDSSLTVETGRSGFEGSCHNQIFQRIRQSYPCYLYLSDLNWMNRMESDRKKIKIRKK